MDIRDGGARIREEIVGGVRLLIYATAGRTKARTPALRATYSTPTSRRSLMSPSSIPEQTSPATSRSSGPGWCQEDRRPLSSGHVAAVVSGRPSACAIGQLGSRSRAAVPVRLYGRRQLRKLSELASGPVRDRLELESCPLRFIASSFKGHTGECDVRGSWCPNGIGLVLGKEECFAERWWRLQRWHECDI